MILAIIGSRSLSIDNLNCYISDNVTEIVTGGAKGIDSCAREYALNHNMKLKEFLPDYNRYGKAAPLHRNLQIIDYSDAVIAFWDGNSRGTKFVIDSCKKNNKNITVIKMKQ